MAELLHKIIKNHSLKHIAELRIDPDIIQHRFSLSCSMCNCNGACCVEGVLLDIKEKERILAYSDTIKKYMEPEQEHETSKWFDQSVEYDIDFPSGKCDGTAVIDGKCVFLDSKGLCVLQRTAVAEGLNKYALKPFYCVAFPLVIDGHVLTTDDPEFIKNPLCCCIVQEGPLTVLDVCREEFEYILGYEGLEEIEKIFKGILYPIEKSV